MLMKIWNKLFKKEKTLVYFRGINSFAYYYSKELTNTRCVKILKYY